MLYSQFVSYFEPRKIHRRIHDTALNLVAILLASSNCWTFYPFLKRPIHIQTQSSSCSLQLDVMDISKLHQSSSAVEYCVLSDIRSLPLDHPKETSLGSRSKVTSFGCLYDWATFFRHEFAIVSSPVIVSLHMGQIESCLQNNQPSPTLSCTHRSL